MPQREALPSPLVVPTAEEGTQRIAFEVGRGGAVEPLRRPEAPRLDPATFAKVTPAADFLGVEVERVGFKQTPSPAVARKILLAAALVLAAAGPGVAGSQAEVSTPKASPAATEVVNQQMEKELEKERERNEKAKMLLGVASAIIGLGTSISGFLARRNGEQRAAEAHGLLIRNADSSLERAMRNLDNAANPQVFETMVSDFEDLVTRAAHPGEALGQTEARVFAAMAERLGKHRGNTNLVAFSEQTRAFVKAGLERLGDQEAFVGAVRNVLKDPEHPLHGPVVRAVPAWVQTTSTPGPAPLGPEFAHALERLGSESPENATRLMAQISAEMMHVYPSVWTQEAGVPEVLIASWKIARHNTNPDFGLHLGKIGGIGVMHQALSKEEFIDGLRKEGAGPAGLVGLRAIFQKSPFPYATVRDLYETAVHGVLWKRQLSDRDREELLAPRDFGPLLQPSQLARLQKGERLGSGFSMAASDQDLKAIAQLDESFSKAGLEPPTSFTSVIAILRMQGRDALHKFLATKVIEEAGQALRQGKPVPRPSPSQGTPPKTDTERLLGTLDTLVSQYEARGMKVPLEFVSTLQQADEARRGLTEPPAEDFLRALVRQARIAIIDVDAAAAKIDRNGATGPGKK